MLRGRLAHGALYFQPYRYPFREAKQNSINSLSIQ